MVAIGSIKYTYYVFTIFIKHKKAGIKNYLLRVCAIKRAGDQHAVVLQSSRLNSMKHSSNYTHALRERS